MPKTKVLQKTEARISTADKNRPKSKIKRRKKKLTLEWSNLLRCSFLIFLVGIIVFHYYLQTEGKLGVFYLTMWGRNKEVLSPLFIVIGYTLMIFLIGFWFGKRR
jgi:hypothetical protein